MAKNTALKKQEDDFDFSEMMMESSYGDEAINGMMGNVIEASNHQMRLAFDLTKLVVEKSSENMNEEAIFLAFKRASKTVAENLPLKALWEKLS